MMIFFLADAIFASRISKNGIAAHQLIVTSQDRPLILHFFIHSIASVGNLTMKHSLVLKLVYVEGLGKISKYISET